MAMTMTPIRLPKAAAAIAANRASSNINNTNLRCLSSEPPNRQQSDNEAWWSLSSLHKRVATIIATSLPNESLSVVHKSLSEKLNEADSHKSVSINEAIVSARARDAHHQTLNGGIVNGNTSPSVEKQKQLEKEIEQRALEKAQERMQLELEAMKQQMQRKEEERIQKEREEHERELAFERWKENAAREQQQLKVEDVKQQEETSNNNAHHPILGPQIAHLPYKRIHLTSAATLASLPVYEKQRAYRHDRATNMAKDKKKTLWMGIPGVISLMEEDDGRLSILDGQHRVGMMALLEEEQRKIREKGTGTTGYHELAKLDLENILVEVFFPRQSSSDSDCESVLASSSQKQTPEQQQQNDDKAVIFTEINKAEPVKLLDLPGVAPKRTRDMIDHAASHFYNTYPAMFSPSTRCRAVST